MAKLSPPSRPIKSLLVGAMLMLLLLVLAGPFFIPVPPLENTFSPEELADPDSHFIEVNGLNIHYKTRGAGEPVFLLFHGFSANVCTWQQVMTPLARMGTVVAYDRIASGLTQRVLPEDWKDENPYAPSQQVAQAIGLMDALGIKKAIFIGSSAGGTIALQTALAHPDRVTGLILVDTPVYGGTGAPGWLVPLFKTPQMDHVGPLLSRWLETQGQKLLELAFHDANRAPAELRLGYQKTFQVTNWDLALWELTKATHPTDIANQLHTLSVPTLVLTGDDDRIVDPELSRQLADDIPGATFKIIPDCGHLPHEERPSLFLEAVQIFAADILK
jgi:pimeloyl-ACP methyl ester carboxylesterase